MSSRSLAFALLAACGAAVHAASPLAQWREWPPAAQWSAQGSEEPASLARASFVALDKDFDFLLSREEAAASRPVAINFSSNDLDRDGSLSPLEFNNIALALGVEDTVVPVREK